MDDTTTILLKAPLNFSMLLESMNLVTPVVPGFWFITYSYAYRSNRTPAYDVLQNPNTNLKQSKRLKVHTSIHKSLSQNLNNEAFPISISLDPSYFGQKASA